MWRALDQSMRSAALERKNQALANAPTTKSAAATPFARAPRVEGSGAFAGV